MNMYAVIEGRASTEYNVRGRRMQVEDGDWIVVVPRPRSRKLNKPIGNSIPLNVGTLTSATVERPLSV